MSLHTDYSVHGRQAARLPFFGPRLTEWRNTQNVKKSGGDCHGIMFIGRF